MATASRVASGSARVRPNTRDRVERAMRDLLYIAPGRGPSTGAIGLLVPELQNPVFPALAQAMEAERDPLWPRLDPVQHGRLAEPRGRLRPHAPRPARRRDDLHLLRGHGSPVRPRPLRAPARRRARSSSSSTVARRRCTSRRSAWTSVRPGGWPRSTCSRSATRSSGSSAGPEFTLPTREKRAGYEAALLEAGLEPEEQLVAHAAFTVAGGREAAHDLLTGRHAADGRDLLERPCRDRRPPGGGRARSARPRGALDRRASTASRPRGRSRP